MSDNTEVLDPRRTTTTVAGDVIATDDIADVKYQRVKLIHGVDGINDGDVANANPLPIALRGPLAAFGELKTAQLFPQVQRKFVLGTNSKLDRLIQHDGGTVSASNGELVLSTSTTTSSVAAYETHQFVKYEPGEGVEIRLTARFTAGVAGTIQVAGVGDAEDGLFFGYNGADFGVLRRSGGQVEIRTLTITGAPSGSGDITITMNGGAVAVAILSSDSIGDVCRKINAADFGTAGGGWITFDAGNRVIFKAIDSATRGGTYSFVDTDTTSTTATGPAQTIAASAATDTWVAASSWSLDQADGTGILPVIDFTKGNVFAIKYQWLGYGAIVFAMEQPSTGRFIDVHVIEYANANTSPSLRQPDLPVCFYADNGSTTSDISIRSASLAAFTDGVFSPKGVRFSISNEKSLTTTLTNILVLRVKSTFASVTNRVRVFVDGFSFGNNGSKTAEFHVIKNPSLVGAASWTDIDSSDSVMEYDVTTTDIIGGEQEFTTIVGSGVGVTRDLDLQKEIELEPGDILVLQGAQSSGGSAGNLDVSPTWLEEF